ncbi:MAG: glycosyltransferase family 2 protein [bacterium]|nr:glycosyltransferase family 2 protein [bacterium]
MQKTAPTFSIVIPCLNEEKYLPHLLDDLANQTNQDFEVIVVDGNSEDKTVEKAKTFVDKFPLTVKVVQKRNVSYQRNLGGKLAKNNWIIFMDADNRLPSYLLDGVRYQLAKSPSTDIFTLWIKVESPKRIDRAVEQALNLGMEVYNRFGKAAALGAFIGCSKQVAQKISFDEKQKYAEDGMFTDAAFKAGFHFSIFKDPNYFYSLRRIHAEGTLHNFQKAAVLQMKFLRGKNIFEADYPMLGGKYYDELSAREKSYFERTQAFIKTATTEQRKEIKALLNRLF